MDGKTIIAFRATHNLSLQELADLLDKGWSDKAISAYERGTAPPSKRFVHKFTPLLEEFGCDYNNLSLKKYNKRIDKKQHKNTNQEKSNTTTVQIADIEEIQEVVATKIAKAVDSISKNEVIVENTVPVEDRPASEHYHAGKIDVWKFADENYDILEVIGFHRINALKYIARFGKKKGYNHEDLDKAIVELKKLKELTKQGVVG